MRQRVQAVHAEDAPLHHLEHVLTGLAHALHGQERDLEACRFGGEAAADVAAAVAVNGRHLVRGPVVRERLDVGSRNAALALGPLGRLGLAVGAAEHVVLEPVEALGVRGDVVLVVGALDHPRPRDGEPQRRVGVGQRGDPLVCVDGGAVVQVGTDVDLLDADLGPEVADLRGHLAAPAPGRGLGVAAYADDGVGVLGDVPKQVGLISLLADRVHAPHVLGAPVPTLPGVRLASLQREASEQVHQMRVAAVATVHDFRLAVAVALTEHSGVAVRVYDAADLVGADLGGIVPADALVAADAAVLRIALAVGVPVDALQRIRHAVLRIHALLVADRKRRQRGDGAARERVAAHLQLPRVQLFLGVLVVEMQRADARDAPVLHVDGRRVRARAEAAVAGGLVHGLIGCLSHTYPSRSLVVIPRR